MSFTQTLNAREFETERSFEFLWELIEDWKSLWSYYSYPDNPLYVIFVFDKNTCKNWEISEKNSPNLFKKALASHFQTKAPLPDDFEYPWYTKEELTHSAIVVSKAWLEEDKTWTNTQVIPKKEKPYKLFDGLLQLHKKWVNKALQLHFEWINAFFECIQKSCKSVEELLGKFWIFPDDENKLLKPINISIKEENEKTIVSLPNFPYIIVEAENEADAKAKLLETLKDNFNILQWNENIFENKKNFYEFLVSIFWFEIITLDNVFEKPVNVKITQEKDWLSAHLIGFEDIQVFWLSKKEIIEKLIGIINFIYSFYKIEVQNWYNNFSPKQKEIYNFLREIYWDKSKKNNNQWFCHKTPVQYYKNPDWNTVGENEINYRNKRGWKQPTEQINHHHKSNNWNGWRNNITEWSIRKDIFWE